MHVPLRGPCGLRDDPNSCVHGKIVKIKARLSIPTDITVD